MWEVFMAGEDSKDQVTLVTSKCHGEKKLQLHMFTPVVIINPGVLRNTGKSRRGEMRAFG